MRNNVDNETNWEGVVEIHWKKEKTLLLIQPLFLDIISLHQFALQLPWLECTMSCIVPKP